VLQNFNRHHEATDEHSNQRQWEEIWKEKVDNRFQVQKDEGTGIEQS